MIIRNTISYPFFLSLIMTLTACGGGGSSSDETPQTQTGVFLDSAVEGLGYSSGALSGFTDSAGTFEYETGQSVTFTIGDILIGTANGADTLTPVELIDGASDASDPAVTNIARLLQTLDDDGDPSNGILITESVRDLAVNLTINFEVLLDLFTDNGNVQTVVSTLTAVTSAGARTLIDAASAEAHLSATLEALNNNGGGNTDPGNDPVPGALALSGEGQSLLKSLSFTPDTFSSVPATSSHPGIYIFSNGPLGTPDQIISIQVEGDTNKVIFVVYAEPTNVAIQRQRWSAQTVEYNDIVTGQANITFDGSTFQFSDAQLVLFDPSTGDPIADANQDIVLNGSISIPE